MRWLGYGLRASTIAGGGAMPASSAGNDEVLLLAPGWFDAAMNRQPAATRSYLALKESAGIRYRDGADVPLQYADSRVGMRCDGNLGCPTGARGRLKNFYFRGCHCV